MQRHPQARRPATQGTTQDQYLHSQQPLPLSVAPKSRRIFLCSRPCPMTRKGLHLLSISIPMLSRQSPYPSLGHNNRSRGSRLRHPKIAHRTLNVKRIANRSHLPTKINSRLNFLSIQPLCPSTRDIRVHLRAQSPLFTRNRLHLVPARAIQEGSRRTGSTGTMGGGRTTEYLREALHEVLLLPCKPALPPRMVAITAAYMETASK